MALLQASSLLTFHDAWQRRAMHDASLSQQRSLAHHQALASAGSARAIAHFAMDITAEACWAGLSLYGFNRVLAAGG